MIIGNIALIVIGVSLTLMVGDAAIRTFVVPARQHREVQRHDLPRTALDLCALRAAEARLRATRPRDGVVRTGRGAGDSVRLLCSSSSSPTPASTPAWNGTAGADALITSGSSLLTLGFERPPDLPDTLSRSAKRSSASRSSRSSSRTCRRSTARSRGARSPSPISRFGPARRRPHASSSRARTSPAFSTAWTRSGTRG